MGDGWISRWARFSCPGDFLKTDFVRGVKGYKYQGEDF